VLAGVRRHGRQRRWCSSTSTTSRPSTTAAVTRPATACSRSSRRRLPRASGRRTPSRAWAATSSWCCCTETRTAQDALHAADLAMYAAKAAGRDRVAVHAPSSGPSGNGTSERTNALASREGAADPHALLGGLRAVADAPTVDHALQAVHDLLGMDLSYATHHTDTEQAVLATKGDADSFDVAAGTRFPRRTASASSAGSCRPRCPTCARSLRPRRCRSPTPRGSAPTSRCRSASPTGRCMAPCAPPATRSSTASGSVTCGSSRWSPEWSPESSSGTRRSGRSSPCACRLRGPRRSCRPSRRATATRARTPATSSSW